MEKTRLDVALVARGLAASRQKAQAAIAEGLVYVDGHNVSKPGVAVEESSRIEVRGDLLKYVSRGGLKLERALQTFPISLEGAIAMDCGASTGGFTDCMLQNGAAKVFCVDVGTGQLHPSIAEDPRTVNMENTNARYLKPEQFGCQLDFASVDVSFISLGLILPTLHTLMKPEGQIVCLVKPQFEAGRGRVGKKGVVKDPRVHEEVLEKVCQEIGLCGFSLLGLTYSPVRGPEGNIEYLAWLGATPGCSVEVNVKALVTQSHEMLS